VEVAPRSIRILNTVTSNKPVRRRKKKEKEIKKEVEKEIEKEIVKAPEKAKTPEKTEIPDSSGTGEQVNEKE
jgi:hypothetical protein